MSNVRAWLVRLAEFLHPHGRGDDLAAEFEVHLEMQIDANLRAGMSAAEARRNALLKLGVENAKELYRDRATIPWLEHALRDWRYGLRQLHKNRGFALTAISTLGLGICAPPLRFFTFIDAALLKPLPYPDPEQLLGVSKAFLISARAAICLTWTISTGNASTILFRRSKPTRGILLILSTREGTEAVHEARISAGFFRTRFPARRRRPACSAYRAAQLFGVAKTLRRRTRCDRQDHH